VASFCRCVCTACLLLSAERQLSVCPSARLSSCRPTFTGATLSVKPTSAAATTAQRNAIRPIGHRRDKSLPSTYVSACRHASTSPIYHVSRVYCFRIRVLFDNGYQDCRSYSAARSSVLSLPYSIIYHYFYQLG